MGYRGRECINLASPPRFRASERILLPLSNVVGVEAPTMTPELRYLLFTAILTGALWIPVVIGYVSARGPLRPADYKVAPTSPLPDWVHRANRAHMNAVETIAPFAVAVLIAHALKVSTSV